MYDSKQVCVNIGPGKQWCTVARLFGNNELLINTTVVGNEHLRQLTTSMRHSLGRASISMSSSNKYMLTVVTLDLF